MSSKRPPSFEILVPKMGDYLVEKGLIKPDELALALKYQEGLRHKGEDQLIGQILVDQGAIDPNTRDAAIIEFIIELRSALQEANQQLEQRVKERTAELQNALEKLAELNQLKANIIANISHELRTPMTHLKGYLDLVIAGDLGPLTEEQQNALSIMARSGERLSRLIEDLIQFSVSEHDQLNIQFAPFSMQNLCNLAIRRAKPKAIDRDVKLVSDYENSLPEVDGDEEKISWVIQQLLDNAIKFSEGGGTVTLRIKREENLLNISVIDTGIGIPQSQVDKIFDSFHQLDSSTTRKAGGTGLGLALAKKIIEAHGSTIRVNSDVGKGSCFGFTLKIHQNHAPAS